MRGPRIVEDGNDLWWGRMLGLWVCEHVHVPTKCLGCTNTTSLNEITWHVGRDGK